MESAENGPTVPSEGARKSAESTSATVETENSSSTRFGSASHTNIPMNRDATVPPFTSQDAETPRDNINISTTATKKPPSTVITTDQFSAMSPIGEESVTADMNQVPLVDIQAKTLTFNNNDNNDFNENEKGDKPSLCKPCEGCAIL